MKPPVPCPLAPAEIFPCSMMCSVMVSCFVTSLEKGSETFRQAGWLEGNEEVESDGT